MIHFVHAFTNAHLKNSSRNPGA